MSLLADVESRPEVGSSRRSNEGSTRISFPMLVLFLSPPDTPLTNAPPILVCRHLTMQSNEDRLQLIHGNSNSR